MGYLAWTLNTGTSYVTKASAKLDNMSVDENNRGYGVGKLLIDIF